VQEWIEQTHGHTQMQTGIGHQDYQDENFQGELRLQQATLYQPSTEAEESEDEDTEFERDSKYDAARLLPNALPIRFKAQILSKVWCHQTNSLPITIQLQTRKKARQQVKRCPHPLISWGIRLFAKTFRNI
jgi:hypothetical protein